MRKKIAAVIGFGVSGIGAALLLERKGWKVRVTEEKDTAELRGKAVALRRSRPDIEVELGAHTKDFIKGADLVVTSPGVRDDAKPLIWAKDLKIPVIDEIELGYRYCPAGIVAVTGTNGKSTTVTLIGEVLKAGGYDAVVCGNIGFSFCEEVLKIEKDSVAVIELSSFQLQRIDRFRPYVSLFLNITQNHFDRHRDFREYFNAKFNIFKNQTKSDWAISNYDDKNLRNLSKYIKPKVLYFGSSYSSSSAYLKEDAVYVNIYGRTRRIVGKDELTLKGEHNLKNVMAASLVGAIFKVAPEKMKKVFRDFKGLEHRFEYVDDIEGIGFINDSKATTVDAAMCAIRSAGRSVVLIAGGRDKGSDFTVLRTLVEERIKGIVLIGEAAKKIKTQLLGTTLISEARDLNEAVSMGLRLAKKGDIVLFSPMCASFDMFKNFEERGEVFKKAVASLKGTLSGAELCTRLRQ